MKKKFLKITSFILAVALSFTAFYYVYSFKYLDSIFKVKMFYEQEENTVDVLVLGSSHAYQGINTAVLWQEYGIAAYDLCGPAQPIWNTYFYLVEALKTQTPKVIILDAYTLHYSTEYGELGFAIKNTYGLKWSQNKIDAIKTSIDTSTTGIQYFVELMQFHSKYSDLAKSDFSFYMGNKWMYENHKGFYCYFKTAAVEERDFSDVTEGAYMLPKVEEYYRKILELAKSLNIPVIVTGIPFAADNYHIKFFNTAAAIAQEYDAVFLNFLTDYKSQINLDYSTDFADNQHLNYLGNTKLTKYLGRVLSRYYSIPDRRGNSRYDSWAYDADVYQKQLENHNVKSIDNLPDFADVIKNERYITVMTESVSPDIEIFAFAKLYVADLFAELGIENERMYEGGIWIFKNGAVDYYNDSDDLDFIKSFRLSSDVTANIQNQLRTVDDERSITTSAIRVNKSQQTKVNHGLNIYIFDTLTDSTVDGIGFNYSDATLKR